MGIPLETAATAVFGGSLPGTVAAVSIGPDRAGIAWRVKRYTTSTTSVEADQPELKVYKNVDTPSAYIEGTHAANNDSSNTEVEVRSGERLLFIWTGGTPGSFATISISGEIV